MGEGVIPARAYNPLIAVATMIGMESVTAKVQMSKRMSVAAMAMAVLVFIAACGSNATPMPTPAPPAATHAPTTATPTVSDPDSVQATLLRHQDRWEHSGITDYDYTGAWSCFCPQEYLADVAVTVRGGVVTSVAFAGEELTVTPPSPERFVPVEELFALLQDAVTRNAARIEVAYDERYGYPAELFIDYDERMADEETRFVMRGFTLR